MTALVLFVIRGNCNFTQSRLSTSKLRNAFSTVSKYNGTSIISFRILGKTCFIASPIFFILAINESFSACLSLSISRSSFLRFPADSRLCCSYFNCSCAISIFFFSIANVSCLFASSFSSYSLFSLSCASFASFSFSAFSASTFSFSRAKAVACSSAFFEPLFFPALYFPFLVYVPLHVHLPFQYTSAPKLLYLSLVAPSATQSAVSASLILHYVIFQHFLLLLSPQVSVFPLQVSVFPLFLPSQVSVFPLSLLVPSSPHVSVSLHPVSSSSSFASYFPLSSVD